MCAQLPGLHMPYPTLPLLGEGRVSIAVDAVASLAASLCFSMLGYLVDAQLPLGLAPVVSAAFSKFRCHFPPKSPDLPHMFYRRQVQLLGQGGLGTPGDSQLFQTCDEFLINHT